MHLGVCTGGGDCPGLNAAIRAVVRHAIGTYGMKVTGLRDGLSGIMGPTPDTIPLQIDSVTGILDRGGTILGTSNKGSPFKDASKQQELIARVKKNWQTLKLDGLIVIGGDGSQLMARELFDAGLPVVGVPKTIDNDLVGTEQTIGFSTAVDIAAEAVSRLYTTAEAHDRIMVLEVMGRDAGHIALHAGIAGGANVILLPELPYSYDVVEAKVRERAKIGRHFSLIVIAEGSYEAGGEPVFQRRTTGKVTLGGIGHELAAELHKRLDMDTRVTVLGHIQRGGTPNNDDRILATLFGTKAVDLIQSGDAGKIVCLKNGKLDTFSYATIADARQCVDVAGPHVRAAEANGICLGRPNDYTYPLD